MKQVDKVGFAALIMVFAVAFYVGLPLIDALLFGIALAYIVRPVAYKTKNLLGSYLSSFLALAVFVIILVTFILYSMSLLLSETSNFVNNKQYEDMASPINNFLEKNPELNNYLNHGFQSVTSYFTSQLEPGTVIGMLMGIATFVVSLFMGLIFAFYLIKDGPKLKKRIFDLVPPKYLQFVNTTYERADKDLNVMFLGSLLTATFVWIVTALFLLGLGVPYAMAAGLICGILQLVPMVGPQLLLIPLALAFLISGNLFIGFAVLALALGLFLFSDTFVRSMLSKKTGTVHPLIVLIAFIGGTMAFGLKGVVLGPIIFAVLDGLVMANIELGQ